MTKSKMRNNIKKLIGSGITAHTVAVDTGLPRNTVYRIFSGETQLSNVKFGTMEVLENYYLSKFGYINTLINKIENGLVELEDLDPNFHIIKFMDGPTEEYIIHDVENQEGLEVFFAERDFVTELKQKIYDGDTDKIQLEELVYNEYADRFNYDKVAAYRVDGGMINWI